MSGFGKQNSIDSFFHEKQNNNGNFYFWQTQSFDDVYIYNTCCT